jgi:MFS family permease
MRSASAVARRGARHLAGGLVATFAFACGLAVASIYYAQPLIGFIAPELRLAPALAGLLMTLTQAGYGAGLLLLVPLSDVFENRRLALALLSGLALALLAVSRAPSAPVFLAATFLVGALAAAAQILVPFVSHLAPEERRGRVVGQVMAGLLAGIMLARPVASFTAGRLGWRAVFAGAALAAALALGWFLQSSTPSAPAIDLYQTAKGERKSAALADGSHIDLAAATRLTVALAASERRVTLEEGEAIFDVAADAGRPFIITAGDRQVRVVGTEFDVRRRGDQLSVTVRRGVVEVGPAQPAPESQIARRLPGDRIDHRIGSGETRLVKVSSDDLFAWRTGHLV